MTSKAQVRAAVRAARRVRAADVAGRAAAAESLAVGARGLVHGLGTFSDGVCRVAAYESTRTEPPTERLRATLRAAGHEVLLPVITGPRELHWRLDGQADEMPGSGWGADGLAVADLVLTPGLSVDSSGLRLGQGGGYYDAALAHVRPGVPVVTVLWDEEFVDERLPAEHHDRRVDAVLTPGRGVIWLRPGAGQGLGTRRSSSTFAAVTDGSVNGHE